MSDDSGKKDYPSRAFRISPELLERFDAYYAMTNICCLTLVRLTEWQQD